MKFLVLCMQICATIVLADKLPSDFKRCKIEDQGCLKDALQGALPKLKEGLPDWGVPSLDPMQLAEVNIEAGTNVIKLEQKYKNVNIYGVTDSTIESVSIDLDKKKIEIKFHCPSWTFNGTYDMSGNVLVFPVTGSGACTFSLIDNKAVVEFTIETYKKKDETYLKGTDGTMKVETADAKVQFDNLFNGDKALGDNINKILNENWRTINDEVGTYYSKVYIAGLLNIMNRIFSKVPLSELFLS